jgi:hypothetical protein
MAEDVAIDSDMAISIKQLNTAGDASSDDTVNTTASSNGADTGDADLTTTTGNITDVSSATIDVAGNASFDSSASGSQITLGNSGSDTLNVGTLTVNAGGNVTITDESATTFGGSGVVSEALKGSSVGGTLELRSYGAITDTSAGALSVDGNTDLRAENGSGNYYDIQLGDTTNTQFGDATADGDTLEVVGEDISIEDDTATTLAGVDANATSNSGVINDNAGVIQLVSGGAIEDSTSVVADGNASFDNTGAGAPITLGDNDSNDTTNFGSLTVRSDGNVTVNEDSATQFTANLDGDATDVGGTIDLASDGDVTVDSSVTTGGDADLDAAGPITGGADVTVGGSADWFADGNINLTGEVSVANTLNLDPTGNDVTLNDTANDLNTVDIQDHDGSGGAPAVGVVQLADTDTFDLAALTASGNLTVTAGQVGLAGDVDLTGGNASGNTAIFGDGLRSAADNDGVRITAATVKVTDGNVEIGDLNGEAVADLTTGANVTLEDAAVLDVTLNGAGTDTSDGDHDRLIVESSGSLTLGDNPSDDTTGPRITGTTGAAFDLGVPFRVIKNDSSSLAGSFGQNQFGFEGQDFRVHVGDSFGNGDGNDVVLERILVRFIWDGGGTTSNWSEADNWEDNEVPDVGKAVVFDTSLSQSNETVTVDSSADATVEQVEFTTRGGGTAGTSYLIEGSNTITLQNNSVETAIINRSESTQEIDATLEMSAANARFDAHLVNTTHTSGNALVLNNVTGNHPMQLVNSNNGALTVNSATTDLQLNTGAGNTLNGLILNTQESVEVLSDVDAGGNTIQIPNGDVRTETGATTTITADQVTIGDRLEVGDANTNDSVGTLDVDADLVLDGSTLEVTLDSTSNVDRLNVDDGNGSDGADLTLQNGPALGGTSPVTFDVGDAMRVVDHQDADDISGSFANTETINSQNFEVLINSGTDGGDGNDVVVKRLVTNFTWDGGATNSDLWSNTDNWNSSVKPGEGDALTFDTDNTSGTVDNDELSTVNEIDFVGNGSNGYELTGDGITINGDIVNSSGVRQTVGLPVTLSNTSHTFDAASGTLEFDVAVSGAGSLTLTDSSGGDPFELNAPVGANGLTVDAQTTGSDVTFESGTPGGNATVNIQTDPENMNGSLTFDDNLSAINIGTDVNVTATGGIDSGDNKVKLNGGTTRFNTSGGTGSIDLSAADVTDMTATEPTELALAAVSGAGTIQLGDVTVDDLVMESGGSVELSGTVTTASSGIDLSSIDDGNTITLTDTATLDAAGNVITTGEAINGNYQLNVMSDGDVDLQQVGNSAPLAGLNVDAGSGTVTLNGDLVTNGAGGIDLSDADDVDLNTDLTVYTNGSGTADLTGGAVDGAHALTVEAGSGDVKAGTMGQNTPLDTLDVNSTGTTTLTGAVATGSGAGIPLDGATNIQLGGDVTLDTSAGDGPVTLTGGAVNGGGDLDVTAGSGDVELGSMGQSTPLAGFEVVTDGTVTAGDDLAVTGDMQFDADVVTPAATTIALDAGEVQVDRRLEIGDASGSNAIGTVVVNGDLELTGDAVVETTLASNDLLDVNGGGVTLTNSPSMVVTTQEQFDETASFTVIDNDGTDSVSGGFATTTLFANQQEYLVEVNSGSTNDVVINRQDTERVDPTSSSTDRGGRDEVKSTTMISMPGEDGLDETVTDPVPENEQASMAGEVARQGMDEEDEEPTGDQQTGDELPEEEVTETEAANSTSGYLGNSAQRNRDRVEGLQQQLNQLEQEGQGDSDRAQQLREQIDFLTELADRQQQTQQQMTDGQDVSAGGDGDDADMPHLVGVHDVSPDESLQEITADQLRSQLLNDLQLGTFSDAVDGPVLGAVLSGLDSAPIEEPPGVAELRDVTRMAGQWAQSRGDTDIAERMQNVRSDAPWWVNERTLRFRTGVHGQQAPWGMSVVDVRMSRETGQYVLHASVWIDEGASNVAVGDLFEQYAGENVSQYEGSWHTLTLTGQVTPR